MLCLCYHHHSYDQSGWTCTENAMSVVLKEKPQLRLDLSRLEVKQTNSDEAADMAERHKSAYAAERGEYESIFERCKADIEPPMHPDMLFAVLEKKSFPKRGLPVESGRSLARRLFCDVFDEVAWERNFVLRHHTWNPSWNSMLVQVLPAYLRCTLLDCENTPLGDDGCKAICEVLQMGDEGMPSLRELRLSYCHIRNPGTCRTFDQLKSIAELTCFSPHAWQGVLRWPKHCLIRQRRWNLSNLKETRALPEPCQS